MKKLICLLIVFALCLSAMPVFAAEESSYMDQVQDLVDAEDYDAAIPLLLFMIGTCYQDGTGVEQDLEKAAEIYAEALAYGYEPNEEDAARLAEVFAVDDGQNPIMNFIGNYACDRCRVEIMPKGDEEAEIVIIWGNSAFDSEQWTMTGVLDTETLQVPYSDCIKTIISYDRDSEETEQTPEVTVEYTDGTGTILFGEDGTLAWNDDQEHAAQGMVFEYVPVSIDLSEDILGTWETHCTSEGFVFPDGQDHRFEFKEDGTYVFYTQEDDEWVPAENDLNEYFVADNLLCMRWFKDKTENQEYWEIAKDGDAMFWTTVRDDKDGDIYTASLELKKVVE